MEGVKGPVVAVLRLGSYQILYMDSVPDYAAVSESVDLARGLVGSGAASLVNAVLRAVARGRENPRLFPSFDEAPAAWLATWGSHPRWLVDRWLRRWEADEVRALVERNNRVPPLTLVPVEGSPEAASERLRASGIAASVVGLGTRAVELAPGTDPAWALDVISRAVVQDPGASLVTSYMGPPDGRVLDLCAAPGGKSLTLGGGGATVVAADRSIARLSVLRANARRAEVPLGIVAAQAEHPPFTESPVVLVDAPCSGTGTLRRHPDARWRLRPEDVHALAEVQRGILEGAAQVVSSGGSLVYSTCSLEPEENELQVRRFLGKHPEFRAAPSGCVDLSYLDQEGWLNVLPQRTGFDGAFAAIMKKRAT